MTRQFFPPKETKCPYCQTEQWLERIERETLETKREVDINCPNCDEWFVVFYNENDLIDVREACSICDETGYIKYGYGRGYTCSCPKGQEKDK